MGLLRKWRRKRALSHIPSELIYEPLYETLKTFNDEIPISFKTPKKEQPESKKVSITKESVPIIKEAIPNTEKSIKNKVRVTSHITNRSHPVGIYDATYKVVIFGDAGCGKNELTQRFLTNLFKSDTKMTIGIDFEVKSMDINGKKVKLQIWDFGGEERFRFLLPIYVRGANGALFIFNVTNPPSLAHIDDWLLIIRREMRSEREVFPIVVVGIIPEPEVEREIPSEEGINIARSRGVEGYIECSPKTGENVEETFDALAKLMMQRSRLI